MPPVREADAAAEAAAVPLEIVEVEPGVFLKLSAADKKAYADRKAAAEADAAAYQRTIRGEAQPASTGEAVDVIPITILTGKELASIAEGRGLNPKGSKAVVAARIAGGDEAEQDGDGDNEEPTEPEA